MTAPNVSLPQTFQIEGGSMMDLKSLFLEIVTRLEQAKENGLKPEITPSQPTEYNIKIPAGDSSYLIRLKTEQKGVTVNTFLADRPQHQAIMPEASLNDALRVIQAAIIMAYGKSMH
jgi:hypothetical protein